MMSVAFPSGMAPMYRAFLSKPAAKVILSLAVHSGAAFGPSLSPLAEWPIGFSPPHPCWGGRDQTLGDEGERAT